MASFRVICCAAVVVLFCIFQTGESLECIICNEKCQDTNSTMTCPAEIDMRCLSIYDEDGEIYAKVCGTEKFCQLYADCSSCNEDLCNSGSSSGTKPEPNPEPNPETKPCSSPNIVVNVNVSV